MRNLRILGAALAAMFALSAAFSAMASADSLTSESSPVTLTGSQVGVNTFNLPGHGAVECEVGTFDATTATPTTKISGVTAAYSACEFVGLAATVTMNGCTYTLNEAVAGTTAGTAAVVCPEGKEITIVALQGTTTKCTIHVKPQTVGGTYTATNVGAGATRDLLLHVAFTGIHAVTTAGTGVGACVGTTVNTATLTGTVTIKGDKDGTATQTGIFLS